MNILHREQRPCFLVEYGITDGDDFYRYIDYYDDIGGWIDTKVTLVTPGGEFPANSVKLKEMHKRVLTHEEETQYN